MTRLQLWFGHESSSPVFSAASHETAKQFVDERLEVELESLRTVCNIKTIWFPHQSDQSHLTICASYEPWHSTLPTPACENSSTGNQSDKSNGWPSI